MKAGGSEVAKMSAAQKRYAMAKAVYEVSQKAEHDIIADLSTNDMTEDDALAVYIAANEAAGMFEARNELNDAEDALVEWARQTIARKHNLTPDIERLMTTDWKRFIATREKVIDLSFRLAA